MILIAFMMSAGIVWGHTFGATHAIQVDEDQKNSTTWTHGHENSGTKYASTNASMTVDKDSEHSFRGLKFYSADVSEHSHDVIENLDQIVVQPIEGNHEPHHEGADVGPHNHDRIEHAHGGIPLHWHANYNHVHLPKTDTNPRAAPEHNHHSDHAVTIADAHNKVHFGDDGLTNLMHGHTGAGAHDHDNYGRHGHGSYRHSHGTTERRVAEKIEPTPEQKSVIMTQKVPDTPVVIAPDNTVADAPDTKTNNVVRDASTNDNVASNAGQRTYDGVPSVNAGGIPSVNAGGVAAKRKADALTHDETDIVEKPVSLLQPPPKRKRTQCYLPREGRGIEIDDIEYEYPVYIHSIKYDEEFSAILIKFRNYDIEPVILNRYTVALYNKEGKEINSTSIGKGRTRYRGKLYIGKRSRKQEYRDSTFAVIQRKHLKEVFPKVKEKHGRIGSGFVMFHKHIFNGSWTDKEWTVKISCGRQVVFQYPPAATEENETDDAVANAPMNPHLKMATTWAELKKSKD